MDEAMELIRSLIKRVELTPREGRGADALLHGDLARILMVCSTGAEEAKPLLCGGPKREEDPERCAREGFT